MDDSKFDDIIKDKVGEYEIPDFDPSALAGLHHRMASLRNYPWYSRYSTELLIGSALILATIILLWTQWRWNANTIDVLKDELKIVHQQNDELIKLKNEVLELRKIKPDTIRIIQSETQPSYVYASLIDRLDRLEYSKPIESHDGFMYLGQESELAPNFLSELERKVLIKKDGSAVYLSAYSFNSIEIDGKQILQSYELPNYTFVITDSEDETDLSEKTEKVPMSAATIRALKKHYKAGIGLRAGPMLDYSLGFYDIGKPKGGPGLGGLGELILSPSFSLEVGAKYNNRSREIKSDFGALNLPDVTSDMLDTFDELKINSHVIDIPINVKYRHPLSMKSTLVGGIGYSTYLYLGQNLKFENESGGNLLSPPDEQSYGFERYPGSINFLMGLNRELKNKHAVEGALYYQKSLGAKGIESTGVDYLGLRVMYWFLLR